MKSKKITQETYEYENLYAHNVSHFEGNVLKYEENVQEMQNLTTTSSGKRKKKITMDKYFAPRTTQGAQPYIKSVLVGKEDVWKVDIFVERFLL